MARNITFDYDKALDKATRLFWRHGYAHTSLRELLRAMGIGEGSFYNTLKSKKQLFLECLKHYCNTVGQERARAFQSDLPLGEVLRNFFGALLDQLDNPKTPKACLMASSVNGNVLSDPDLRAFIKGERLAFEKMLIMRLSEAAPSTLPGRLPPEIVASIIMTYVQGLFQAALLSYDRPKIEKQIDALLTALGLPK